VRSLLSYVSDRVIAGLLVVAPVYLACLLLLKAMQTLLSLMAPLAKALPESVPAENLIALIFVLLICLLVGIGVRTPMGQQVRNHLDRSLFRRIPGYSLLRSLTQRLAGETQDQTWESALVEIEDALVPGFIIEELVDGRLTVFVPSVPTPMAGAVYILTPDRVHRVDVPFTQAIMTVSKWGSGCKNLVAAMKQREEPLFRPLGSPAAEQTSKRNEERPPSSLGAA
jgi:uncharacterized membrane protein